MFEKINKIPIYIYPLLSIKKIKNVLVTHIHLDHSGGAWKFAKNGASIYVHPKGAPHLISPEKLISSASMIYGNDMDRLWGKVEKINSENIIRRIYQFLFYWLLKCCLIRGFWPFLVLLTWGWVSLGMVPEQGWPIMYGPWRLLV